MTGFLITKELNRRQVKWAEMLTKYHFEIKYIKGTDNAKADILNKKAELQDNKKPLNAILRIDKNSKIKYNHLKLTAVHKTLKSY